MVRVNSLFVLFTSAFHQVPLKVSYTILVRIDLHANLVPMVLHKIFYARIFHRGS